MPPELTDQLKENGYEVILPWFTQDERAQMLEASIRTQVEAQLQGQPAALKDAAIKAALAKAGGARQSGRERAVIAHE